MTDLEREAAQRLQSGDLQTNDQCLQDEILGLIHSEQINQRLNGQCSGGCLPGNIVRSYSFAFRKCDDDGRNGLRDVCRFSRLPCPKHEQNKQRQALETVSKLYEGINQ